MTNNNRITAVNIIKIIAIACLILVDIALIFAHDLPATGYEPSIYASTPLILWISIIVTLICGVAIIIYSIYNRLENGKALWVGFLLVLMFYVISISVYMIRSYYLWAAGGDASTHLMFVKQIVDTGYSSVSLIYPVTHIFTAQLFELTNVDLLSLEKFIPLYFSLIYILVFYLLARSVFVRKGEVVLATVIGCIFLLGYQNYTPNYLANCLFPLFLFILIKLFDVKKLGWIFLAFTMVFLYPTLHIIPTFVVIVMLISFIVAARVYRQFYENTRAEQYIYGLILIVLVTWSVIWITSFDIWNFTIQKAYDLLTWGGPSYLSNVNSQAAQAQDLGYNVAEYILKQEGNFLALILMTIGIFPVVWSALRAKKSDTLLFLYASILSVGAATVAFFFLNVGFSPLRLLTYLSIICALFVGYALYTLLIKAKTSRSRIIRFSAVAFTVILITALFISGLSVLYPSPYTVQENLQTTKQEVAGMSQLLSTRDIAVDILNTNLAYYRFAHLLLTPEELKAQKIPVTLINTINTPFHFGYDNNTTFSSTYPRDAYLLVTQRDRSVYTDVFPELANMRFTPSDFTAVSGDASLSKIYTNGQFDTYYLYHRQ